MAQASPRQGPGPSRRLALPLAAALAMGLGAGLGACVPVILPVPLLLPVGAGPVVGPGSGADACGAASLQTAIGAPLRAVALPEDRPVRVIRPGDLVTQDFAPGRLNVELDARGRIAGLRCG